VRDAHAVPSADLTFAQVLDVVRAASRAVVGEGARGVVVTQGTDTLEETSFLADLVWPHEEPLVFTGAMRNPTLAGADGPANLLASVLTAGSGEARGLGALVVFNDEIHAPRWVRKAHSTSTATFVSPNVGPIGQVIEGRVRVLARPPRRDRVSLEALSAVAAPAAAAAAAASSALAGSELAVGSAGSAAVLVSSDSASASVVSPVSAAESGLLGLEIAASRFDEARVALYTASLEDDGLLLSGVGDTHAGLVVAGYGVGHVTSALAPVLGELAERMPVVLASRTGAGSVLRHTYGAVGSEVDLQRRGLINGGLLDPYKARVLLRLLLAAGVDRAEIVKAFDLYG
jgi:L-asparaginase